MASFDVGVFGLASRLDDDVISRRFGDAEKLDFNRRSSPKQMVEPPPFGDVVSALQRAARLCPGIREVDLAEILPYDMSAEDEDNLRSALLGFQHLQDVVDASYGTSVAKLVLTPDFTHLQKLHLNNFASDFDLEILHSFNSLKSLKLRIGSTVKNLNALKTGCPHLRNLFIKEIEDPEHLNVMEVFRGESSLKHLEQLTLEEQRGGGGYVNATYPDALADVFETCPNLTHLQILVRFKEAASSTNPFLVAPTTLKHLKMKLFFPYDVNTDVSHFCDHLLAGFRGRALEKLSFQSYDHVLESLYDVILTRVISTQPQALTSSLSVLSWHVSDASSWARLRDALPLLTGLEVLRLTVQVKANSVATFQAAASGRQNSSVKEIVVDFLPEEISQKVICGFDEDLNQRSAPEDATPVAASVQVFRDAILPSFSAIESLLFDNFKTIPASFTCASIRGLKKLSSPTVSVLFNAGDFTRLLEACPLLEDVDLNFADGVAVSELASLTRLRHLVSGSFAFKADGLQIASGLDFDKLQHQQQFHEKLMKETWPDFLQHLSALPRLRALHLFFDVLPVGADYLPNLKNGVATGFSVVKDAEARLTTATVDWA